MMFQKVDRVLHMGGAQRRGTTAGVLPREPDELCARLLPLHSSVRTAGHWQVRFKDVPREAPPTSCTFHAHDDDVL
jgi:hypothetical protein